MSHISVDITHMSVIERIRVGHYKPTMAYPVRPTKPAILSKRVSDLTVEEIATILEAKAAFEAAKISYEEQLILYKENGGGVVGDFKGDLEKEYSLTGHPKASKLYEIAYDMGHHSGMEEVANHYDTLSELLLY